MHLKMMHKTGLMSKPVVPIMESLYRFAYHNPLAASEKAVTTHFLKESSYFYVLEALYQVIIAKQYNK
jgi:hypothetical protein